MVCSRIACFCPVPTAWWQAKQHLCLTSLKSPAPCCLDPKSNMHACGSARLRQLPWSKYSTIALLASSKPCFLSSCPQARRQSCEGRAGESGRLFNPIRAAGISRRRAGRWQGPDRCGADRDCHRRPQGQSAPHIHAAVRRNESNDSLPHIRIDSALQHDCPLVGLIYKQWLLAG